MSNPRVNIYADLYESQFKATVTTAEGVPEGARLYQAAEGKSHPLWLLGHLCMSANVIVDNWTLNGDITIPMDWMMTFGPEMAGGKPITGDAGGYPGWDELLDIYKKVGASVVEHVRALSDADLDGDPQGPMPDNFKPMFGNMENALRNMAVHEGHHRGQIALLVSLA